MWKDVVLLFFLGFELVFAKLITPEFHYPAPDNEILPAISQEELSNAFRYAEVEHRKRLEEENKYIEAVGALLPQNLTGESRLFGFIYNRTMAQHRIQEKLEDATNYIAKRYKLTQAQTRSLRHLKLPEDEPLLQECLKYYQTPEPCDGSSKYRTRDGSCNNLQNPSLGRAFTAGGRMALPHFDDGIRSPRKSNCGGGLPNPRMLTRNLSPDQNVTSKTFTHTMLSFGQFVLHNILQTILARAGDDNVSFKCCPINSSLPLPSSCMSVEISKEDERYLTDKQDCHPFTRSAAASLECKLGIQRQSLHQHSVFIDLSITYGQTAEDERMLRKFEGGLLQYQNTSHGVLMPASPFPDIDLCSSTLKNHRCFLAADFRHNVHPGLVMMHTFAVRQHNKIAGILAADYPNKNDEELFQEARRIMGAMFTHMAYKEYIPSAVGSAMTKYFNLSVLEDGYTVYDPKVDPTMKVEFNSGAARYGHSTLQNFFSKVDPHGALIDNMDLSTNQITFFPEDFYHGALDSFTRGTFHQPQQDVDRFYTRAMTEHCIQAPDEKFGLDLLLLEVQRGREHGLAPYVDMLNYCFNINVKSFDDLSVTMPESNIQLMKSVYNCVEDVDFFVGGLLETVVEDGIVGPTFACVMGQQFHDIKFGDRFYYEHGGQAGSFTEGQLRELRKLTVASFICDNSDNLGHITPDPLRIISPKNELKKCEEIPKINLTKWFEK